MEAGLQKIQDVGAQTLALAYVTLHQGDTAWLDLWLVEFAEKVLQRIARLNADREIH